MEPLEETSSDPEGAFLGTNLFKIVAVHDERCPGLNLCLLLLTLTFVFAPPTGDQVEISFYSLNHGEIVSKVYDDEYLRFYLIVT